MRGEFQKVLPSFRSGGFASLFIRDVAESRLGISSRRRAITVTPRTILFLSKASVLDRLAPLLVVVRVTRVGVAHAPIVE